MAKESSWLLNARLIVHGISCVCNKLHDNQLLGLYCALGIGEARAAPLHHRRFVPGAGRTPKVCLGAVA